MATKPFDTRVDESSAALQATDLRDINDLNRGRQGLTQEDSDWIDPFIKNFRDYLQTIAMRNGTKPTAKSETKLWTAQEIIDQLGNFLQGRPPIEPTTPEAQQKAIQRLDEAMVTEHRKPQGAKEGIEYVPTPRFRGSANTLLRSIRQHSGGLGGKI